MTTDKAMAMALADRDPSKISMGTATHQGGGATLVLIDLSCTCGCGNRVRALMSPEEAGEVLATLREQTALAERLNAGGPMLQ